MSKRIKFAAAMTAMILTTGTMFGCSSAPATTDTPTTEPTKTEETAKTEEPAKAEESTEKQTLTVWSHLTSPEVTAIGELANKWGEENNVEVKVLEDQSDMQGFLQAANSKNGPDVMFGLPHDNLGTFQKAGLLAEVPAGKFDNSAYASQAIVDAVTINGTQYAVPLAQETIGLFYNKDLCSEAPETWDDLIAVAQEKGFMYNVNDFYLSYGIVAANGGYVFKNNAGTLDPTDIGLGNDGAIKSYQFLQDLITKYNFMPADINDDIAKGEFLSGNTAFYISGPWNVGAAKDAGMNFGIAPLPKMGTNPTPSFLGVQTAFVSAKSEKQDLAFELVKYLSENSGETLYDMGNRIPVLTSVLNSDKVSADAYTQGFAAQAVNANPMPNIPEVAAMWAPAADNIKLLTAGQIDAATCGKTIADQIAVGIAQQK